MFKRLIFLAIFIILIIPCGFSVVNAEDGNNIDSTVNEIIDNLDLNSLEDWLSQLFEAGELKDVLLKVMKGQFLSSEELQATVLNYLRSSVAPLMIVFVQLFSIMLICGILSSIKPDNGQVQEIVFLVCYCGIGVLSFSICIKSIKSVNEVINGLSTQIECIFPILLTILSAIGAKSSVAVYQPLCAGVVAIIVLIIQLLQLRIRFDIQH